MIIIIANNNIFEEKGCANFWQSSFLTSVFDQTVFFDKLFRLVVIYYLSLFPKKSLMLAFHVTCNHCLQPKFFRHHLCFFPFLYIYIPILLYIVPPPPTTVCNLFYWVDISPFFYYQQNNKQTCLRTLILNVKTTERL